MTDNYYVKSFRKEFDGLQTLLNNKKVTTQTVEEIFDTLTIKPNTLSFRRPPRLCTTIIDKHYTKTYRPQGLIFNVNEGYEPDYIFPFDLNAITENNNPVVEYHAIKDKLHLHYNVHLIDNFMQFASQSYGDMVEKFKNKTGNINPKDILSLVNDFRVSKGWKKLDPDKQKLVEYNEAIFLRPVKINIVAIFGNKNNEKLQELIQKHNIPYYSSTQEFYDEVIKKQD